VSWSNSARQLSVQYFRQISGKTQAEKPFFKNAEMSESISFREFWVNVQPLPLSTDSSTSLPPMLTTTQLQSDKQVIDK